MTAGTNRLRRTKRNSRTVCGALVAASLAVGAGTALAQGEGGIEAPPPPSISDVDCSARCLNLRTVAETGRIEISGEGLGGTEVVRFPADEGKLKVEPRGVSDESVVAEVPEGADSGAVSVVDDFGLRTVAPVKIDIVPADAIDESKGFRLLEAEAAPAKTFYNSRRRSEVDYLFEADEPADIRIDVISETSGETVDSIIEENQKPFANHSVAWDGLSESNAIAPNGDYRFKVSPLAGGAGGAAGFSYYDHIFPLRSQNVQYGDGLGAGRGHQGQDVFARCGTEIVAARGGKVQVSGYHSAAGNYVVIDGRKTGQDYVYMHMEPRGLPQEGSRLKTGDLIGYESDTGRASGCHLHFELWSAPGWYEGGQPINPTGPLKKWDGWS